MSDEVIRALEHALAAASGDAAVRLRLSRELARTGRRRDALDRLALGSLPDAEFSEGKELSETLWRAELARLGPVASLPTEVDPRFVVKVDRSGSVAALFTRHENIELVSLETNGVVRVLEHGVSKSLMEVNGGFSVKGADGSVRRYDADGHETVADLPLRDDIFIRDVCPEGDLLSLHKIREGREGIYQWSSFEPLLELPCRPNHFTVSEVDWIGRRFLAQHRTSRLEVVPFDGGSRVTFALAHSEAFISFLGRDLVGEFNGAVAIHDLRHEASYQLIERCGRTAAPSLSSDGRSLRVVVGGSLLRFVKHDGRAPFMPVPEDLGALAQEVAEEDSEALWHPHADVAAALDDQDRWGLHLPSGDTILEFELGLRPRAWLPDGWGLLVERSTDGPAVRIEVWRPPEGSMRQGPAES